MLKKIPNVVNNSMSKALNRHLDKRALESAQNLAVRLFMEITL